MQVEQLNLGKGKSLGNRSFLFCMALIAVPRSVVYRHICITENKSQAMACFCKFSENPFDNFLMKHWILCLYLVRFYFPSHL